ncbi:MAG: M14 family zinc carboxypeptidase, partial [Schleiferiaceae bacterium]
MKKVVWILGLVAVSGVSSGPDGSFGPVFFPDPHIEVATPALLKSKGFSTQEEVDRWFADLAHRVQPAQVKALRIGTSSRGRIIQGYRITGPQPVAEPVRIWIQGALHGDEQATPDRPTPLSGLKN